MLVSVAVAFLYARFCQLFYCIYLSFAIVLWIFQRLSQILQVTRKARLQAHLAVCSEQDMIVSSWDR